MNTFRIWEVQRL